MTDLPAGGVDMPPKTDPHDMTTPSGRFPTMISKTLWYRLQQHGADVRWYAAPRMIPIGKYK